MLAFAFALAVVTYLDRICISAAAPFMMADLDLSMLQMSVVFSAFTLAYSWGRSGRLRRSRRRCFSRSRSAVPILP